MLVGLPRRPELIGLARRSAGMRRAALVGLVLALAGFVRSPSAHPARAGGWSAYWTQAPRPSIRAVRPDGTRDHGILRTLQNAKRPRLSPDRAWVAFDGAPPGRPPLSDFDVQVVRLDGTGRRTLTRTRDWDTDAQWSPDGARLSFTRSPPHPAGCGGSSIWIVRSDGSAARKIVAGCAARWSPDGRDLVYTAPNGRDLRIVDVGSGRTRALLATRAPGQQPAGWSPDGQRILFTRLDDLNGRNGSVL